MVKSGLGSADAVSIEDVDTNSSSEDQITPIRSRRKPRAVPVVMSSDEDSDSQVLPAPVTPKKRVRLVANLSAELIGSKKKHDLNLPISDENQDLWRSPTSEPSVRQPRHTEEDGGNAASSKPGIASSDSEKTLSDDEVVTPARRRRSIPKLLEISSGNESTSSEDEINTPSRRRRLHSFAEHTTPKSGPGENESRDLEDDLADLSDNGAYSTVATRKRNRTQISIAELTDSFHSRAPTNSHQRTAKNL